MKKVDKKILIFISIVSLLICPFKICAQEREDAKVEARQHYLQGKEYYSQGRYQEATDEFERAIKLLPPRIEYKQRIETEFKETIVPSKPAELSLQEKLRLKKEEAEEEKEEEEEEEETAILPAVTKELILPAAEEREYYLDIGDVLDISVWQVPDLSRPDIIVRPDGKISFPLVGDIKAEGLTLTKLDAIITENLKTYVKSPEVSIMIRRFGEQANKVVILGEIRIPGVYKFGITPTITEVIASAGGYTNYAVLNSIMVIRRDGGTKPEVKRVNVAQVLKRGRISQNVFLKPNDIVYVPRSFIGKINVFLQIMQPAIDEYMQTLDARHLHHVVRKKGGI